MKKRWILIALETIFYILLISVTTVYADDCSVGRTPDGVYPMEDADIVMESEDIKVDVEKGFVECNFVFKNTGEEKDILMGFPAKMEDDGHNTYDEDLYFKDFKTFIDKNEIPVKVEKGINPKDLIDTKYPYYSSWYTFSVHFKAGETKHIKNTYSVTYTSYSMGQADVGYILKTGAFWKDKIGYAKVTFDFGDIELYRIEHIYPFSMHFEGKNKIVWEKRDFEPDFDLLVRYHQYYFSEEYFKYLEENDKGAFDEGLEKLNSFNKLEFDKMSQGELLSYYNRYIAEGKNAIAKYIESKMPEGSIRQESPVIKDLYFDDNAQKNNTRVIIGTFEDENGDIVNARIEVSHIENGEKVVDFNEVHTIGEYQLQYQREESYEIDFLQGINYDIEFSVKDSQDNVATKKIKYFVEPVIQDPVTKVIGEEDKDQGNEEIKKISEENTKSTQTNQNNTNQNNTNSEKVNTEDAPAKRLAIIPIIVGSIGLLIILMLIFVVKKEKPGD